MNIKDMIDEMLIGDIIADARADIMDTKKISELFDRLKQGKKAIEITEMLLKFHEEYKEGTHGCLFPGNDYWSRKGMEIVDKAKELKSSRKENVLNKRKSLGIT